MKIDKIIGLILLLVFSINAANAIEIFKITDTTTSYQAIGYDPTLNDEIGQSFSLGNDAEIIAIGCWYTELGTVTDNVILELQTDSATFPSGTLVSANANASFNGNIGSTPVFINSTLNSPTTLTAGDTYHIVFSRTGILSTSNLVRLRATNAYSGANSTLKAETYNSGVWSQAATSTFQHACTIYYNLVEPPLLVNITNITANGQTFINNTVFETRDIEFNVTYDVINSPEGNFTNSSIINIIDQANGVYNIQFEVCYNSTCDTSGNYTYYINVTKNLIFDTINLIKDPNNTTGNYSIGNIQSTNYLDYKDEFGVTEFAVYIEILNQSTNGLVNVTYFENGNSQQFITNALNGTITASFTGDGIREIYFTAINNETNKTTQNYTIVVDTTAPIINHNIPTEINSYNLTGININVSDLSPSTCLIDIEGTNYTCSSFTAYNFTTNGYKPWTIYVTDIIGKSTTEHGEILVNPYFYVYINNGTNDLQDFYINGSFYENYFTGKIYDYGLGSHLFTFQKGGYNERNFTLTFTNTSEINTTIPTTPVFINIQLKSSTNGSNAPVGNYTLFLTNLEDNEIETYSITNDNKISVENLFDIDTEVQIKVINNQSSGILLNTISASRNVTINLYLNFEITEPRTFQVFDYTLNAITNSQVFLYKYISGSGFILQTIGTTNSLGQVSFDIIPDTAIYTVCNTYENQTKCLNQVTFTNEATDPYLIAHDPVISSIENRYNNYITWNYNENKTGNISQMTFTFNDAQNIVSQFCYNVTRYDNSGYTNLGTYCNNNPNGQVLQSFYLLDNESLKYIFYYVLDGNTTILRTYTSYGEGIDLDFLNYWQFFPILFMIIYYGAISLLLNFKQFTFYKIGILSLSLLIIVVQAIINKQYIYPALWVMQLITTMVIYSTRVRRI